MRMPVIVIAAAALGCAASRLDHARFPGAGPVPDAALGLARGSVFDIPVPPPVPVNAARPGEALVAPRPYPGAPPVIPHATGGLLPIGARENACLGCHGVRERKPGEAAPVPGSHTLDPRRAPDQPAAEVAGAWWVCTTCHVGRTGARPLVGNGFRP